MRHFHFQIWFYTNEIFRNAGIPESYIQYTTVGTGAIEVISGMLGVSFICNMMILVDSPSEIPVLVMTILSGQSQSDLIDDDGLLFCVLSGFCCVAVILNGIKKSRPSAVRVLLTAVSVFCSVLRLSVWADGLS